MQHIFIPLELMHNPLSELLYNRYRKEKQRI